MLDSAESILANTWSDEILYQRTFGWSDVRPSIDVDRARGGGMVRAQKMTGKADGLEIIPLL